MISLSELTCNSFVPAAHATIGLTDKILTRIHTRESASRVAFGLVHVYLLRRCADWLN